jgi:preprotein translocase subunit SecE
MSVRVWLPLQSWLSVYGNKGETALKIIEMEKVRLYFVEAYDELVNKVTWPTWAELQESSVIVLVSAIIISLIVVLMDIVFKEGTQWLYNAIIQ